MIFLIFSAALLVTINASIVLKRPFLDGELLTKLCYSGNVGPSPVPVVEIFDVKGSISTPTGLKRDQFCSAMLLTKLRFGDEKLVGTPQCATSGFTATIVVRTTPKKPTMNSPVHEFTCKFNVNVDRTCSSSTNNDKRDALPEGLEKRQPMPANFPCATRTTRDACHAECEDDDDDTSTPFLADCQCLWDDRDPQNVITECTGRVCCFNAPCERFDGLGAALCVAGGGGTVETVGMTTVLTPKNCAYNDVSGECRCAAPLLDAGYPDLSNPTTEPAYTAPFDCYCPYVSFDEWLTSGVCVSEAQNAPVNLIKQAALSLALLISKLNNVQYAAACKPCSIKIGGRKSTWFLAKILCGLFTKLLLAKKIPFIPMQIEYGCGLIAEPSQCPSLLSYANSVIAEDQRDQVPVEMLVDVDVPAPAVSSGSIAAVSVAVLVLAVARLL